MNFDWRSELQFNDNNSLALLAGAGIRQKVSNNDIETSMIALDSRYTTRTTEDPTRFPVNVISCQRWRGMENQLATLAIAETLESLSPKEQEAVLNVMYSTVNTLKK